MPIDDPVLYIVDTQRAGLGAEPDHRRMRVDPGIIWRVNREGDVVHIQ